MQAPGYARASATRPGRSRAIWASWPSGRHEPAQGRQGGQQGHRGRSRQRWRHGRWGPAQGRFRGSRACASEWTKGRPEAAGSPNWRTWISNTGLPLGGLSSGLEKSAGAAEHAGKSSSGLRSALGSAAGPLAAVGVGLLVGGGYAVHLAEGMETADASIAGAAGTSVGAAKQIGDAFLSTAGKSEILVSEMAKAFAGVAGQLKATEGHALYAGESLKFMTAAGQISPTATQDQLGLYHGNRQPNCCRTFQLHPQGCCTRRRRALLGLQRRPA